MLDLVLTNCYTTSAIQQRIALLKEFFEYAFYGTEARHPTQELFNDFVNVKEVELEHATAVREWGQHFFGTVTAGTLYSQINGLLNDLKEVPVLTLYTPVKFSHEEIESLGKRIRILSGKKLLLDDRVDVYLSVGCAFVWNGVYHDYSLPFFFGRKREELTTLITRYGGTK